MYTTTTLTAVISLFLIAIIANTECKPVQRFDIQACGKELADLLATTCQLGYNRVTKTFTPAPEEDSIAKESKEVDEKEKEFEAIEEKRTLHKRSIIQECCVQPCRWDDLFAYCYNGSSMKEEQLLEQE